MKRVARFGLQPPAIMRQPPVGCKRLLAPNPGVQTYLRRYGIPEALHKAGNLARRSPRLNRFSWCSVGTMRAC